MTAAPTFTVTDHALLRWLERVHGIDVPYFREQMRAEVETSIFRFDPAARDDCDRHQFVMDGDRIVTVLEPGWRSKKQGIPFGFVIPRVAA